MIFFSFPLIIMAQCDLDRHNTSEQSGWISCDVAQNPNAIRGNGHWIAYDFTFDYFIEQLNIWNHNHPESLNYGVQDVVLDVSSDGTNWTEVASLNVPQASGESTYAGFVGPVINQRARYLLITAISNHGGSCTAIGEIKVGVMDEIECQNYDMLSGDLGNRVYYADQYINTDGVVSMSKVVQFRSGGEVNILDGFEAEGNSELVISIEPCEDN